jgi:hypothetical protein
MMNRQPSSLAIIFAIYLTLEKAFESVAGDGAIGR